MTNATESRVIHDLRSPLIIAIGYLDELRILKAQLLKKLSSQDSGYDLASQRAQIVREVEDEMTICIKMIGDSLDELDNRIEEIRVQVE